MLSRSFGLKVSAQPLHIFSNVIASDQRAEEHARAGQIGNTSTLISHDTGSLRRSLNDKILETRPCKNAMKPIVKAMRQPLPHHWLISPAWRYALNTLDLLEKERPRPLTRPMETIEKVKKRGGN